METVADREWRLIRDTPRDGALQMALEEIAVETALADGVRTVRTFDWQPSTLSMGYRQEAASVDWEYCEREGIDVTRRQTGGGGIYHDEYADVSYTIVAPADEVPGDLLACYKLFCEPLLDGLTRLGVDADFATDGQPSIYQPSCFLRDVNPAHDIVVPVDGASELTAKKISGNAQYRRRDAVIQHGSIRYALEPDRHLGAFAGHDVSEETFRERVTSVRDEVAVDRETTVQTLVNALKEWCGAEEGTWSDAELDAARALADEKYGADAWVRNRETIDAR